MTDNLRGIIAVLIASTAFVVNDAAVKLVSDELPSGEIIVVRGVLATALLAVGVAMLGAARPLSVLLTPMMALRLIAAGAATTFIVISLRYVPLATVNTVLQVTPLLVTAGAAILYAEKVGLRRWLAALTGFAGVLLIVKPGSTQMGAAAFIVLVALAFTTMRDLTTRGLERSIPSVFVAAASAVVITLAGFLVAPFDTPWAMPTAGAWGWLWLSRRVPVHCHDVHRHRATNGRDRGRRAVSLRRCPAFGRDRLLVVGRSARHAGLCRHRTGRCRRALHLAPRAARLDQ